MAHKAGWTAGQYSTGAGGCRGLLLSACSSLRFLKGELLKNSLTVSKIWSIRMVYLFMGRIYSWLILL